MRILKDLLFILFAFVWQILMMFGGILLVKIFAIVISAVTAWFLGLFIGDVVLGILAQIGISGFSMLQIGLFVGFIASFFTSPIKITDLRSKKKQN